VEGFNLDLENPGHNAPMLRASSFCMSGRTRAKTFQSALRLLVSEPRRDHVYRLPCLHKRTTERLPREMPCHAGCHAKNDALRRAVLAWDGRPTEISGMIRKKLVRPASRLRALRFGARGLVHRFVERRETRGGSVEIPNSKTPKLQIPRVLIEAWVLGFGSWGLGFLDWCALQDSNLRPPGS
jgi:hypothetical protein